MIFVISITIVRKKHSRSCEKLNNLKTFLYPETLRITEFSLFSLKQFRLITILVNRSLYSSFFHREDMPDSFLWGCNNIHAFIKRVQYLDRPQYFFFSGKNMFYKEALFSRFISILSMCHHRSGRFYDECQTKKETSFNQGI